MPRRSFRLAALAALLCTMAAAAPAGALWASCLLELDGPTMVPTTVPRGTSFTITAPVVDSNPVPDLEGWSLATLHLDGRYRDGSSAFLRALGPEDAPLTFVAAFQVPPDARLGEGTFDVELGSVEDPITSCFLGEHHAFIDFTIVP